MAGVGGSRRRPRASTGSGLGVQSSRQSRVRSTLRGRRNVVSSYYIDIGDCIYVCTFCNAYFWHAERLSSTRADEAFKYNKCCQGGTVRLRISQDAPEPLAELLDDPSFMRCIRKYNSLFSMTSFGANIDNSVNEGSGPYVFKVSGQVCHWIVRLCPDPEKGPRFQQLYIYDTEDEVSNRIRFFKDGDSSDLSPAIVSSLLRMLDANNDLVKVFRMARDFCLSTDVDDYSIRIFARQNERTFDSPYPGTIGRIVIEEDELFSEYDIVVHHKTGFARRISKLHPSYMPLQYPLLFPFGQSGWSPDLTLTTTEDDKNLTMNMFYSHQLHERQDVYSLLLRSGRLLQQYIVDAYVSVEHNRLEYIRTHQNKFRTELLKGVHDAILQGDTEGSDVGKRTFLPSSFTGGPRYMYKHYQDALAICRVHGNPQYFITFTCNANWPEIQRAMRRYPTLQPQDRPDIVSRVFHIKVQAMIDFLKKKKPFGEVEAHLYTIEFQKRGLPHCHLLLWVTDAFKIRTPEQVDRYISAEIPDPRAEPELYEVVTSLLIHGPCGPLTPGAPCMSESKTCKKNFPKDYQEHTIIDDNGYAHYKRSSTGFTFERNGFTVDNGFVVPYNKLSALHFCAHINVEYCGWSMLIKYLFKYISKGADRIHFIISRNSSNTENQASSSTAAAPSTSRASTSTDVQIDEIKNYVDGRYVCPQEAAWRILKFSIHHRHPAVQVLSAHLENQQPLTFRDDDQLEDVASDVHLRKTTLTEWLRNNRVDESGRHLRYIDYLKEFRWDVSGKFWLRRVYEKTGTIGRLTYIHPTCGEVFYLRMLLAHQAGCRTFADIRTVAGHRYDTYREASDKLGLLGDDKEWINTLEEASFTASSSELRSLFVHMLLHCNVTDPLELWNKFWHQMSDDITHTHGFINEPDLRHYVLYELELLIRTVAPSSSLAEFNLPMPKPDLIEVLTNKLLMEEKNYDRAALQQKHSVMHNQLHPEQLLIYDFVTEHLNAKKQVLAFVYGHGGTGKTFLWKTIIYLLRSRGQVVLAVAASGVASLLLPNGRAAHSRFRIPIDITNKSVCNITKKTNLAKLLHETSLIFSDEAPMSERNCLESLDRTLKDILDNSTTPFGGMSILLGGDFRQTLPIRQRATKSEVLDMSLPRSPLWRQFRVFKLTENMRLQSPNLSPSSRAAVSEFSSWLLNVGDGVIGDIPANGLPDTKIVTVPGRFLIPYSETALDTLIDFIYDGDTLHNPSAETLSTKAIVTPRNETVDEINDRILNIADGDMSVYLSYDSVVPHASNHGDTEILYPIEYLNSLHFNGLPPHCLRLKKNTPIILLRNINQTLGLCNGTRLIVTQLLLNVIEARIITGTSIGKRVYIPRIILTHNDKELPFCFKRKQFPAKLCYAMTINKSQGQSLNRIGVYLPHPAFSHGQLYVALSRATSPESLRIVIVPNDEDSANTTRNIVYTEFFTELDRHISRSSVLTT